MPAWDGNEGKQGQADAGTLSSNILIRERVRERGCGFPYRSCIENGETNALSFAVDEGSGEANEQDVAAHALE